MDGRKRNSMMSHSMVAPIYEDNDEDTQEEPIHWRRMGSNKREALQHDDKTVHEEVPERQEQLRENKKERSMPAKQAEVASRNLQISTSEAANEGYVHAEAMDKSWIVKISPGCILTADGTLWKEGNFVAKTKATGNHASDPAHVSTHVNIRHAKGRKGVTMGAHMRDDAVGVERIGRVKRDDT